MPSPKRLIALLCISTALLIFFTGDASADAESQETASPYFYLPNERLGDEAEGLERFPLKHTSARVDISGVIAHVEVRQVYKNEGSSPIEAIYVFPGSTRAAIHGLSMRIGERSITAKIKERARARSEYEAAREEGKTATLLEQQRPNVFEMNVANILPQDEVVVSLSYTELLVPTDAIYEFVYPTVVGPRYAGMSEGSASASESWLWNPFLSEGEKPSYSFDIELRVDGGMPIQELRSASHAISVDYKGPSEAVISLKDSERHGGNKDFRLAYRLAGSAIHSGISLHRGEKENFFLAMMQPPKRVTTARILPREYIFVVDVSGSMHGFPLDISKKLMRDLLGGLRPSDAFNVILFAGGSQVLAPRSIVASRQNIKRGIALIDEQDGAGSTEILPALEEALRLPRTEEHSRSIVIITDGYVAVEEQSFDLIRSKLGEANVFTFGIGSSVNRHLIEGMARVGLGEPFVVSKAAEAVEKARKFREYIQAPVLRNIEIDFEGFEVYDVEPKAMPELFAERPLLVYGKWRGEPSGSIRLRGDSASGPYEERPALSTAGASMDNPALPYLWARKRIELLDDYNSLSARNERVNEIRTLGLSYNLLTAYTSFVAIDDEVRNRSQASAAVRQPLPLPQGVSNYATSSYSAAQSISVGGSGPAGSFTEAAFEDNLVRNNVANAIALIEGAVGAMVMLSCFVLSAVFFCLKRKQRRFLKTSLFFLTLAVLTFGLRTAVGMFFGTDYVEYSQQLLFEPITCLASWLPARLS